jgi:hypothetical protein
MAARGRWFRPIIVPACVFIERISTASLLDTDAKAQLEPAVLYWFDGCCVE